MENNMIKALIKESKFNFKSDKISYLAMLCIQERVDSDQFYAQPLNAYELNEMCVEFSDKLKDVGITEYNFNSYLDNGWSARWKDYQESLMIMKADELNMMAYVFFNFMEMFLRYTQQRFIYSECYFQNQSDECSFNDVLNIEALDNAIYKFER